MVVHAVGGWIALPAVLLLGARRGRYARNGQISAHPPSSIPFLALGAWILIVGWFGFNVMSAQRLENISGLVAINSLMAMVGGTVAALAAGRNDPGFVHNGPLAGLVAVCAGSDVMHPLGALVVGAVAGGLFVVMFTLTQNRWKIDDVLGVWPLHGLCGAWGGLAAGIFGSEALGGLGGVAFASQAVMTALGIAVALAGGVLVYGGSSSRWACAWTTRKSSTAPTCRSTASPRRPSASRTGNWQAVVRRPRVQSRCAGQAGRRTSKTSASRREPVAAAMPARVAIGSGRPIASSARKTPQPNSAHMA